MVVYSNSVINLGQYFTPQDVAKFMVQLITSGKDSSILEPAAGTGVFVSTLEKTYSSITAIEIDETLPTTSKTPLMYLNFFDFPLEEQFDVVIGNPPYIRWRNLPQEARDDIIQRKFWDKKLNALSDLMQAFIFKSIDHLKTEGQLIFITPKFWFETLHATNLRQYIVENGFIDLIIDFSETKLFPTVSSNLVIFRFYKRKRQIDQKIKVFTFLTKDDTYESSLNHIIQLLHDKESIKELRELTNLDYYESPHPVTSQSWKFYAEKDADFINYFENSCKTNYLFKANIVTSEIDSSSNHKKRIGKQYVTVSDVFQIGNGMVSGLDKAFWIEKNPVMKKQSITLTEKELPFIKKVVKARFMEQYNVTKYANYIFIQEKNFSTEKEFKKECPNLYALLEPFKEDLLKRWSVKPVPWYVWSFPRNQSLFETCTHKFFLPCKERFDNKGLIRCVYESGNIFGVQDITVLGLYKWVKESPEFLLAYLNSELLYKWLLIKGLKRGGVFQFSEHPLSSIPVRLINWQDKREITLHNQITTKIRLINQQTNKQEKGTLKKEIEKLFRELIEKNTKG